MRTLRLLVGGLLIAGCASAPPAPRLARRAAPVLVAYARSAAWLQGRIGGDQVRAASGCVTAVATGLGVVAFDRWVAISTLVVSSPRGGGVGCADAGPHPALIW